MIRFYVRVPADPHFECDGYDTIDEANAAARQVQARLKLKAFVDAAETDAVEFVAASPELGVAP